ncbi:Asp-tRNA(Asn)/Glu-tRNA(Gln) amidotransferase GatCAB subunit C [Ochrobactrum sp. XJ1]|nr:Asp-tRNA(Asn)/Glu-tRNA(Gln) amidotransferase GatCAB subunit C [Ochrobactrum sp. XJ1]
MGDTTFLRTASHWGAQRAEVRDGRLVALHPWSGDRSPSPVTASGVEAVYAPTRITTPMVREGWLKNGPGGPTGCRGRESFVSVSWDTALDLVAAEINRVRDKHGNRSIFAGSYGWGSAGRFHHANFQLYRFMNLAGGFTEKTDSYSFAAGTVLMPYILGGSDYVTGRATSWKSMVGSTELMVMFGGMPLKNVQMEYGGIGSHSTADWLGKLRGAGTEFVNISLLKEDAAPFLEAQWIAPRPNTDTALMLGLAYTLVAEGLHDGEFLNSHCVGFARFLPYLMGETDGIRKDPDWASSITGIAAQEIVGLARRMASRRTMITVAWSLQRADHGEQPYWMAVTLAAMLGQIGTGGGGVGFGYGCEGGIGSPRYDIRMPGLPTGRNKAESSIPVARLSDMLLNPGASYDYRGTVHTYPDIRMIYWCGGNPFHHQQDLNRLVQAWQRPETIIVHEPWWNAHSRMADIVLPATTSLERRDLTYSSRDRFIMAMDQVIAPVGEARDDHAIFAGLADKLGFREAFTEGRNTDEWLRELYRVVRANAETRDIRLPDFDSFWSAGIVEIPEPDHPEIMLESFRRDPVASPLKTPSGRIEIYSETIAGFGYDDCPGHPTWLPPGEWLGALAARNFPLHLISNQPRERLHGQMDNFGVSRSAKIAGREPILINSADAVSRGIGSGDIVRVFNDRGSVLAGAIISDEIRPGVVCLSTGATYDPEKMGVAGSLDKHGNVNVLTADKGTSKLAQACSAQSALVEISLFTDPLPDVSAFDIPTTIRRGESKGEC